MVVRFHLLIEPFGIEIVDPHLVETISKKLLIEPFGIEIRVLERVCHRRRITIEPFGIEIWDAKVGGLILVPFNRTF